MVLDCGYHGSTTTLAEVSPYKYKRRGGGGRPEYVHELPVPDPYRAPSEWPAEEVAVPYAAAVSASLEAGAAPGAFLEETIPSCAGQVVVPHGFFMSAFESVRADGGICILDEVQVGFGRVGTAMWAFEEHGVVTEIVTLGKPMGNGHPLGAVVTTPEVAAAFAAGPVHVYVRPSDIRGPILAEPGGDVNEAREP